MANLENTTSFTDIFTVSRNHDISEGTIVKKKDRPSDLSLQIQNSPYGIRLFS